MNKPYKIKVPGFITDKRIGLGDLIKNSTTKFGIKPCGGCQRRAEILNNWFLIDGKSQ